MAPSSTAQHMATTTLKVEGMTCGACTSAVESGFKDVAGVGSVSVSLVMERAVVQHDPHTISAEKVREIIDDRGFDAEVLSTDLPQSGGGMNVGEDDALLPGFEGAEGEEGAVTTTLKIEGMTCGACTSAVEGGFAGVAGIKSVNISLLSERGVIEHDPQIIAPEAVREIIDDRGFDATILETKKTSTASSQGANGGADQGGAQMLTTTTVAIEGMTCGSCTSAVEKGFKGVDGLVQFNISLLAERAVIIHDPIKLPTEKIPEMIEDCGFDAQIVSSTKGIIERSTGVSTIQFKVFGLGDSDAASNLEKTLTQLEGVSSCTVAFSTGRVTVNHKSSEIGVRALVEAIEQLGLNALMADSEDNNAQLESLAKTKEIQQWRRAFRTSLAFAIPVFLISMIIPMYIPILDFGSFQLIPGLWLGDVVCLILTIPVQFGIGKRFYISAYKSIKHGSPTMDVLVVLGTSAAFFFSAAAMLVSLLTAEHTRPSTVFDTSTMLITFITLGRFLENRAKGQTSQALSRLMSLAPSTAKIYSDPIAAEKAAEEWDEKVSTEKSAAAVEAGGNAAEEKIVPTEHLELGDIVIIRPGDKIPADGMVTRGHSYLDESMVTGEALPIIKKKGSTVMAGTVNGAGRIDFRVTRAGRDTQLSQIVKLVQEAQTSRAPIQRMADIVAGYFVPAIIALGLITFTFWMIISHVLTNPPSIFLKEESGGRFMVCLKLCISVIVFACPCALGLATPTAVMVGTGVGANNGILVKGGAALETATRIDHIVFDKTGTLTFGRMSVSGTKMETVWEGNDWRRRLWWTLVGLAEMGSEHPIGKAIVNAAKNELGVGSEGMIDGSVGDFQADVGKGISATVEPASSVERKRYRVIVGNAAYLHSQGVSLPDHIKPSSSLLRPKNPTADATSSHSSSTTPDPVAGTTQIHTAIDSAYAGTLSLADTLKPSARAAILALRRMGIASSLVTGDQPATAHAIAAIVGIPAENVHAGVSPDAKQAIIKQLQSQGNNTTAGKGGRATSTSVIAMVGDGINDSPALATADVGIALSSGTDVAMEAADVVLMRPDDVLAVPASVALARSIFNRIKLNLGWACVYNLIGLPFAMGLGLALPHPFMLPPLAAGAAMALSSVTVVGSSLLLRFWKRPRWMTVSKLEGEAGLAPLPGLEEHFETEGPLGEERVAKMEGGGLMERAVGKAREWWEESRVTGLFGKGSERRRRRGAEGERERGDYVPLGEVDVGGRGRGRTAYGDV